MRLPKPFYSDGRIVLYHGDCRTILPRLRADVMVTDPPFGMRYSGHTGYQNAHYSMAGDESVEVRDWVLSRWTGAALVFGTWKCKRPAGVRELLIWNKGPLIGMGNLSIPWRPNHEEIYVIGAGFAGHRGPAVLCDFPSSPFARVHPTAKPVALMKALIEKCPPGRIVDPFAGGGATLLAAQALGRRAVGIEIDQRYCLVAAQRLRDAAFISKRHRG